jgi:transposase
VTARRSPKTKAQDVALLSKSSHTCEWTEFARQLEVKLAAQDKRVAELERMFARKSEKLRPMPPIQKPARTQAQANEVRKLRQDERAAATETVTTIVAVAAADKECAHCNDVNFRAVGEGKSSETIHYVKAHLRKQVTRRETCVCRCGKTIITAEAPERWSEKTQYASSFVAYLVTQKCMASMPIYRLEAMLSHLGMKVARSTMNDLFYRAAQKLEPLRSLLFQAIAEDFLVHMDETSFKLTSQKKKAQMWAFVGESLTGYVFDLTRAGSVPTAHLGSSVGAFVSDDYSGYNALAANGSRTRCGCMAHARRGVFEAGAVVEAEAMLAMIQQLYRVEYDAVAEEIYGTPKHLALRSAQSKPIFTALVQTCRRAAKLNGPKTLLGKAARYICSNVSTLKRFLYDIRIPLDNNLAENALRTIAVGRKNFLFVQSKEAGAALALLYSLTASCARLGVNPIDYLEDVLERIDDTKVIHLRQLLPDRWKPRSAADPSVLAALD